MRKSNKLLEKNVGFFPHIFKNYLDTIVELSLDSNPLQSWDVLLLSPSLLSALILNFTFTGQRTDRSSLAKMSLC